MTTPTPNQDIDTMIKLLAEIQDYLTTQAEHSAQQIASMQRLGPGETKKLTEAWKNESPMLNKVKSVLAPMMEKYSSTPKTHTDPHTHHTWRITY